MGLDLFNWLIKKPITYIARQRHGMEKGTRIAEGTIAKVGPVLAQVLLENSDRIAKALNSAEARVAGDLDRNLFNLARAENILRAAVVSAGLRGEAREYVQEFAAAYLREKLPQAEDATRESIAAVFTAIRLQIDQIAWEASSPSPVSVKGTTPDARP
ncbi:MAG: hypothetical protein V4671_04725 [Armatimonadota bacterium]